MSRVGLDRTKEEKDRHRPIALQGWLNSKRQHDRLRIGVSFQQLHCYGYTSSQLYQSTITSWALAVVKNVAALFSTQQRQRVEILHDFEGLVLPGEMLLVLGRPGSGCSTLLKTLAGDTQGCRIRDEKKINYQGIPYNKMHEMFKGECIYLAELDVHFPELTLGETLTFATRARNLGGAYDPRSAAKDTATLFDLSEAFETRVGNAMIPGLSGGEKKRTSLAEAFTSGAQFQCWDNSTRGLDSSTALRFIRLIRESTCALQSTVIMSIYQASEAMYKDFDKVTLLYEGRQIYFGPADSAGDYFIKLGFAKPQGSTTADFLTSITNPAERIVRQGYWDRVPRSPDEFAGLWKQSVEAMALQSAIREFKTENPLMKESDDRQKQKRDYAERSRLRTATYTISVTQQIQICIQRGFARLRNNIEPAISAVVGQTVIAIILASIYFNLDEGADSMDKRAILLFFTVMMYGFSPAFEIMAIRAQRAIVEKHNRYAFYRPLAEGIASYVCDLPQKFIVLLTFHVPIYFMTNLRRTSGAFFTYLLFMLITVLCMSMFFRMLGSLSRTLEGTIAPNATIILLSVVYTGFVVPTRYMVPWLGWFRWINPVYYAFESLLINEFRDRQFHCTTLVPTGPDYPQPGMDGRVCSALGAVPGRLEVQGSDYLQAKYGYPTSHLWRNVPILLAMTVILGAVHLLAAELIPAKPSRGDVLLFGRGSRRPDGGKLKPRDREFGLFNMFVQDVRVGILDQVVNREDASETFRLPNKPDTSRLRSGTFYWSNLNYDIKTQKGTRRILDNIHGWVKPGTMTALMGVTGAGKTSLLNVLASRATIGVVGGDIYVDGKLRDEGFSSRIGYAQQEDIHEPTATVREALIFSAMLRQPRDRPKEEKQRDVETVLEILEMEAYADAVIGAPGEGLNVEQRKRLTIAVEMVARPEILLFLDEPTSGLDSQTAWSICTLLRKLTDCGQAIFCTIHQPSSQLFLMFDRLLLLDKSGKEIYFGDIGPEARSVIEYFEGFGGPKYSEGENPAEWILEITRSVSERGDENLEPDVRNQTWPERWSASRLFEDTLTHLEELKSMPSPALATFRRIKYTPSMPTQFINVGKRTFLAYWRDPLYVYSRMGLSIGTALANGLSFVNSPLDIQGFTNVVFSTFLITHLYSTVCQQIAPHFANARALFEARESRAKTYSWVVFVAANVLVEMILQTLAAVLVFVCWYFPLGTWRNGDDYLGANERSGLSFVLLWLFGLWTCTLSHAVTVGIEHPETAVQIAILFYWLSLVFSGILASPTALPGFWIFMYRISPLTYFMKGLIVSGLANADITCSAIELLQIDVYSNDTSSSIQCGEYLKPYAAATGGYTLNPAATSDCLYCPISKADTLLTQFGMDTEALWRNVGLMIVYIVFNILATFAVYWLARVPKRAEVRVA